LKYVDDSTVLNEIAQAILKNAKLNSSIAESVKKLVQETEENIENP
jgi:hypothetical protein